jgi:hypothetical protein
MNIIAYRHLPKIISPLQATEIILLGLRYI